MGSPLEKWFALMILTLIDTLTPYQLVTRDVFSEYYKLCCADTQRISFRRHDGKSYKTSIWQIHAVTFQVLITRLLGVNRNTRYIHSFTTCGMFWIDMAEKLLTTVRDIFGCDGMEILNDKIKATLRLNSNKFGVADDRLLTLIRIMRWHLWDHIEFRETNPHIDTRAAQKSSLKKQGRNDRKTLEAADALRTYFGTAGLNYLDDSQYLLGRQQTAEILSHLQLLDGGVADLLESKQDSDWTNVDSQEMFRDDYFEREVLDSQINDDAMQDSDSDDDEPGVSFDTNKLENKVVNVFCRVQDSVDDQAVQQDVCGLWEDLELKETRASRLFMGAHHVIIEGHFVGADSNSNNNRTAMIYQKMQWAYKEVYAFAFKEYPSQSLNSFYFKFTKMPKVFTRPLSGSKKWVLSGSMPTRCGARLSICGAIRVDLNDDADTTEAMRATYRKHCTMKHAQLVTVAEFAALQPGFDENEFFHAAAVFRKNTYPVFGDHQHIAEQIKTHFTLAETGRKPKLCANCSKVVHQYQTHAVCILPEDDVDSVSKVILGRLGCTRPLKCEDPAEHKSVEENDDPEDIDAALKVEMGTDPSKMTRLPQAQFVIKSDPLLWTPYLLNVFARCVSFNVKKRARLIQQCKTDADWEKLALRPKQLFGQLNYSMQETLNTCSAPRQVTTLQSFLREMFAAVSGVFHIKDQYYAESKRWIGNYSAERARYHLQKHVFWKTHTNLMEVSATEEHFIEWGLLISAETDFEWTCWRHPKLSL